MSRQRVLIDGTWRESSASSWFRAENPSTRAPHSDEYSVSDWSDCDAALAAADKAFEILRDLPGDRLAAFLERFAERIEARKVELVEMANSETALPKTPRLGDVELPRTTNQLRLAATAAREGSWREPIIDTKGGLRSMLGPIGPVCVFGPNNFPFAFNSASGGDFAAAIAAGNPVIAKANSSHPGTTRLLAEEAALALAETKLPPGTVQLIYRTAHADGERLVSDPRTGATGYTGAREAGLTLKRAADQNGKPIYLELSSVNPVVILPGALSERFDDVVSQFVGSCLMGTGQFCTNPGLVLLVAGDSSEKLVSTVAGKFAEAPVGTLLSKGVLGSLERGVAGLIAAGAKRLTPDGPSDANRYAYPNTLLRVSGKEFLSNPHGLQGEAFGNASLFVVADDLDQLTSILDQLEGNLTGCVYSDTKGSDDAAYTTVARHLRPKVGRLLNDKMPTGVAVSAAMNHGGPYPSTGHAGFTAVGIPTSIRRFAVLQCWDGVRPNRLPPILQDINPQPRAWRCVDGRWTKDDISA
jgi:alpha-ketoglutaric semialdehyde dehydrogenase